MFTDSQLNSVLDTGGTLIKNGDSPSASLTRFYKTIQRLFLLISNINKNLEVPAIPESFLNIAINFLNGMGEEAMEPILTQYATRSYVLVEDIKSNKIQTVLENATMIFSGVPEIAQNAILTVLKTSTLKQTTIDEIFVILQSLMRMAMKRQSMLVLEEFPLVQINPELKYTVNVAALATVMQSMPINAQ
jgi:hypothetical protein